MDQETKRILESVAYAMAHPIEAAAERQREEDIHRIAFVLAVSFSAAEPVVTTLCDEFKCTREGLYGAFARGDDEVWARANALTAIEPKYRVGDVPPAEYTPPGADDGPAPCGRPAEGSG